MHITVRLFARLRDIAGSGELVRQVPDGSTARALWDQLVAEYTEFTGYRDAVSTAINEEYAKMDRVLADGDEVAFLPPVSGG
jgi:molybdopterin synthase sulfur carrier subunit